MQPMQQSNETKFIMLAELTVDNVGLVQNRQLTPIGNTIRLFYVPNMRVLRITIGNSSTASNTNWFYNFAGAIDLVKIFGALQSVITFALHNMDYQTEISNRFKDQLVIQYNTEKQRLVLLSKKNSLAIVVQSVPKVVEFCNTLIGSIYIAKDLILARAKGWSGRQQSSNSNMIARQAAQIPQQVVPVEDLDLADEVLQTQNNNPPQQQNRSTVLDADKPILDKNVIDKLVEDIDDFLS